MPACEKCWGDAFVRAHIDPSKLQADHYRDLLEERKNNPCTKEQQQGEATKERGGKMENRKVNVFKLEKNAETGRFGKIEDGEGLFRGYGCDYEEFDYGPGNFSTAIVEMPDGTVRNLPLDLIVFKEAPNDNPKQRRGD